MIKVRLNSSFDQNFRVIGFALLEAICSRLSGFCNRFEITERTKNRVEITYFNPNEYGSEHPISIKLPYFEGKVVFDMNAITSYKTRGSCDYFFLEQAFYPLFNCPTLYRTCRHGQYYRCEDCSDTDLKYYTKEEIALLRGNKPKFNRQDILLAYQVYCTSNYSGQWSKEYIAQCVASKLRKKLEAKGQFNEWFDENYQAIYFRLNHGLAKIRERRA